jgi:hypothetical protein
VVDDDEKIFDSIRKGNYEDFVRMIEKDPFCCAVKDKTALWGPLHLAAYKGKADFVNFLIDDCMFDKEAKVCRNGAAIRRSSDASPLTCIGVQDIGNWRSVHLASWKGHLDVVKLLHEKGAAMNEKNIIERTPLHCAAIGGSVPVVEFLCDKCSLDPSQPDLFGRWVLVHS